MKRVTKENFISIDEEITIKIYIHTFLASILSNPFLHPLPNPIYVQYKEKKKEERDKNPTIHFQITKKKKKKGGQSEAKGWKRDKNLSSNSHDPWAHPRRERFLRGRARLTEKDYAYLGSSWPLKGSLLHGIDKERGPFVYHSYLYLICIYIYIYFLLWLWRSINAVKRARTSERNVKTAGLMGGERAGESIERDQ